MLSTGEKALSLPWFPLHYFFLKWKYLWTQEISLFPKQKVIKIALCAYLV